MASNALPITSHLLWKGIEYPSLENCLVAQTSSGIEVSSTIIGLFEEKIFKVDYILKTNLRWETLLLQIKCRYHATIQKITLESEERGKWWLNGQKADQFNGCIDVDIPLTPFTNTLPIRRLDLEQGKEKEIRVIYLDLLESEIRVVHQKYSRLSDTEYHYQNVPNDFESAIEVDDQGFVVNYPGLFERIGYC